MVDDRETLCHPEGMRWWLGVLLTGCADVSSDTVSDDVVERPLQVEMNWMRYWVQMTLLNTSPDETYRFGMAETGVSCASDPKTCWMGEDCLTGPYCHPISYKGGTLLYHGDPDDLQPGT
ncbi:MAG: hypothetical protein AAFV53_15540, partial [Myxococcota bacterium]